MQDFSKLLDEYNKENLISKLNDKLKANLKPSTIMEIKEFEKNLDNYFNLN